MTVHFSDEYTLDTRPKQSTVESRWLVLDPDKVKTLDDIVLLLSEMDIRFISSHPRCHKIRHLLKEEVL